jgi:hypothetical protein
MKLEKEGRIAYRIRSEKTLNFLFEHARKEAAPQNNEQATEEQEEATEEQATKE